MPPEEIDSLADNVKPLVLKLLRQISGLTVCRCYSHDHAFRHSGDCRQTQQLSGQTAFPKEITGSQKGDYGFLPVLGMDGLLDLAALNVENRIRGISLPVDDLILPIIGNGSPTVTFDRNSLGSNEILLLFATRPSIGTAKPPRDCTGFKAW